MPTRKTFKTTLREGAIPLPFVVQDVFGKARAPVKVTLNGYSYRSTTFDMGDGPFVPLRASHREGAGLEGTETLTVTLELDEEKREITPPEDLVKGLKKVKGAWDRWSELSFTAQKEYVEALQTAKKPETRARRLTSALEAIAARPPKKRK